MTAIRSTQSAPFQATFASAGTVSGQPAEGASALLRPADAVFNPAATAGWGMQAGSQARPFKDLVHDSQARLSTYADKIAGIPERYKAQPGDSTTQLRSKADGAFNERQDRMNEVRDKLSPQGLRDSSARKAGNHTLDSFIEKQIKSGKYEGKTEADIYKTVIESSGRPGGTVTGGAKVAVAIGRVAPAISKSLLVVGAVHDGARLASAVGQSVKTGDNAIAAKEAARITGGWTGAWMAGKAGAIAGAELGALIGAPFAGVGAGVGGAVGGFVGGVAGSIAGYWGGAKLATQAFDHAHAPLVAH